MEDWAHWALPGGEPRRWSEKKWLCLPGTWLVALPEHWGLNKCLGKRKRTFSTQIISTVDKNYIGVKTQQYINPDINTLSTIVGS